MSGRRPTPDAMDARPPAGWRTLARAGRASSAAGHALCVLLGYSLLYALFFSPVLFSDYLLAPGDGISYFLPGYNAKFVFWDDSIWGGFPAFADAPRMPWYPPAWLFSLVPYFSWQFFIVSAYALASSFAYGYVRALTGSRWGAAVGGTVYGLCGFMIAHLGHAALIHAAAWLPLCLWSFEMLRRRAGAFWYTTGTLAIACAALAGHPQIFVYILCLCAAAVLCGGRRAVGGRWRYYALAASVTLLGVGLAALQLVPTAELAGLSLRASLGFAEFNSYRLPLRQLPMLLFPLLYGGSPGSFYGVPYFGKWGAEDGGWGASELTGYVGLLPLLLAAVGVLAQRRQAVVWFWTGVALVAVLLALGDATPLAALIYRLPVLNKFRVPARHFIELAMAVSVLAGFGVRAIQQQAASARLVRRVLVCAAGVMAACLLAARLSGEKLQSMALQELGREISIAPWANPAAGVPLLVLLAASGALLYWTNRPGSAWRAALLCAVLVCDLASLGWFFEWHYEPPYQAYLRAPAAAAGLRETLDATHQRLLPVRGGTGRVNEIPPNLSQLWGFDSASGYGPFILARVSRLLTMPPHGSLDGDWRNPNDQSLDLMAVRYLLVPRSDAATPTFADARGVKWTTADITAAIGSGCGAPNPETSRIEFSAPVSATSLNVVSALACSEQLGDQAEFARVRVIDDAGQAQTSDLRAGRDSSEWAYDCADVRPLMKQSRAEVFRSYPAERATGPCEGHDYVARVPLAAGTEVKAVEFQWSGPAAGTLALKKISLFHAPSGTSTPVSSAATLSDSSHWRHVADFDLGNSGYPAIVKEVDAGASRVYENLRSRPRAWLVQEVLMVTADEALASIHSSRLPDGRAFDAARLALVEAPLSLKGNQLDPRASAEVVRVSDGVMEVRTASASPAFLVTSDAHYPGWEATVDGAPAPLFLTNYALRGVPVPAGAHLVRFVFRPRSFYYGIALSAVSLFILIGCVMWLGKRPHTDSPDRLQTNVSSA